jgi:hypothetical protein
MGESVFQTFLAHFAGEANSLRLTRRSAFLRKKSFRIGLGAESALLPGELNNFAIA